MEVAEPQCRSKSRAPTSFEIDGPNRPAVQGITGPSRYAGVCMSCRKVAAAVLGVVLLAASASAQVAAGITGQVKDATGAVLPGVTVEAASSALIEKTRTVVTDGQGRYNIVDLRPGVYTVAFTLPGFTTVKREGVELTSGFTAAVNADLKVGGVEETVMVTGASPVVDIQNVRTQQVMKLETLEALPSGQRDMTQFASLTLGATASTPGRNDVGGAMSESNTGISIHGGRGDDGRTNYDGMNTNMFAGGGGGQMRLWKFNTIGVQETVIDTGGAGAETETGGANVNMVPRDGGNTYSMRSVMNYTNENLSSGKVSDALVARGSAAYANSLKKVFDYGVGIGGPIVRDRLWFYNANRWWGSQGYGANNYYNISPDWWRYVPDLNRPAHSDQDQKDVGGRFTWQAAAKQKMTYSVNWQRACNCWFSILAGARQAPEAAIVDYYGKDAFLGGMWMQQGSWTYTVTNRLLFQVSGSVLTQQYSRTNPFLPGPEDISITEQTTGYRFGSLGAGAVSLVDYGEGNPLRTNNFNERAAISYVTGSHSFKAGVQALQGLQDQYGNVRPSDIAYTFRNGVPLSITELATPLAQKARLRSVSLFAQDQWTVGRMTLNGGLRFDHFAAFSPAITLTAGRFRPSQSFPETRNLPNFKDVTPRVGVAWDLFGNGKTAVKGSWGRYLSGQGGGDALALQPAASIITSTTRLWNDTDRDFVPDCVLENPVANGECLAIQNPAFGQPIVTTVWDESARTGWNVREHSYQSSIALQHELRGGVGLTVGYYRTDWRNQQANVNLALSASDYTPYCVTAPTDARLDAVSGSRVCGLYDENLNKAGQVNIHRMLAKDVPGATQRPEEVYNGLDIGLSARFARGGVVQGGVGLGRTTFDYCWQNDLPNVTQIGTPASLPRSSEFCEIQPPLWSGVGSQIKLQAVYPLPGDFVVSGTFKHLPGIPVSSTYTLTNGQAAQALGRDLSACRGATPCTATANVQLLPAANNQGNSAAVKFDDRLNQTDLRVTRTFRFGRLRAQGIAEVYNVFNSRPAQAISTTYGSSWQLPTAILGGRLFKFGAQLDY
jgi:hypothetical protein